MRTDNVTLVERILPTRAERSIARLYPDILQRLLDAARQQGRDERIAALEAWPSIDSAPKDQPILAASINHGDQEVVIWRAEPEGGEEGWGNTGPECDRFWANAGYFTHYRALTIPEKEG